MNYLKSIFRIAPLCTVLFLMFSISVFGQKNSFGNLVSAELRNFGPIYENNTVTGYYFFYQEQGKKSRDRKFTISILDQNLSRIGKKIINGDYSTELDEGTYNGDLLAFKVTNHSDDEHQIYLLDRNGEQIGKRKVNYGTFDSPKYKEQMGMVGLNDQSLMPVPGKGFLYYSIDTKKGPMSQLFYKISFIPNDNSDEKAWDYTTPKTSKDYEIAGYLASNDNILLSTVAKREKLMSRDLDYYLMATDMNTGEKLFEKQIENPKYEILINNAIVKGEQVKFYGQYYPKGSKTIKEASLGLCTFVMDMEGNVKDYQYLSWAEDFKQLLPSNKKGKIDDVGYLYFHSFVETPDGSSFAIAENYRKAVSGGGATMKVLSGGAGSAAKVVVEDLYILEFGEGFSIKNIEIIDKSKHNVQLPSGASFLGPQVLALIVKTFHGFDYVFTQQEEDLFSIGYIDFEKRKKEKNGLVYGAVNYLDGEFTTDKIDLSTDADELRVLPAKTGYIAIWEYFRKDKKMDIRLERVNF